MMDESQDSITAFLWTITAFLWTICGKALFPIYLFVSLSTYTSITLLKQKVALSHMIIFLF